MSVSHVRCDMAGLQLPCSASAVDPGIQNSVEREVWEAKKRAMMCVVAKLANGILHPST